MHPSPVRLLSLCSLPNRHLNNTVCTLPWWLALYFSQLMHSPCSGACRQPASLYKNPTSVHGRFFFYTVFTPFKQGAYEHPGVCNTVHPQRCDTALIPFCVGADFHRAMVETTPGEKLLIGRRPVRNWAQLQFFRCFTVNSE